jgi:hypothetical protein
MKTSYAKSFVFTLTLLALMFSGLGVTPAYAAASISVDPTSWNAGGVAVGTTVYQTIKVTNTGDVNINTAYLYKSISPFPSDFTIDVWSSFCPYPWKPGTYCMIYIKFIPSGGGPQSANLTVNVLGVASVIVPLSGGPDSPAVSLAPASSWDFSNQNVGSTSAAKPFTLTNTGTANLIVNTLTTSGEFAFSSGSDLCTGKPVAPLGTCTFGVTFSPTSAGVKSGSVSIPSNATTVTVPLSGTGVDVPQVLERSKNGGVNTYAGTSKVPASWVKSATFAATDGKDIAVKKEGTASVKIVGATGKTKTLTQSITLSGLSGDTFTFTFWAKGASIPTAGICRAQVLLYNGATLMLTKTVACKTGTYAAFGKKTLTFNATSAYTKVVIKFTYSKASGTVWFDLISLLK